MFFLLIGVAVILAIPVLVQLVLQSSNQTQSDRRKLLYSEEAARSGLAEAVSWFQRQVVNPVGNPFPYPDAVFAPTNSTGTAACCTLDPAIGLTGEYLISSGKNLWARYEVRRQGNPPPMDPLAAHDVTPQWFPAHSAGEGLAWSFTSTGYAFRRIDPAKPFDQAPNEVLNRARLSLDIWYVGLQLPVSSALVAPTPAQIVLDPRLVINGGDGVGISVLAGVAPNLSNLPVSGTPAFQIIPGPMTFSTLFGMDALALRRVANEVVDPKTTALGSDAYSGTTRGLRLTFVRKNPGIQMGYISLNGSGVLVVDSDAQITISGWYTARSGESVGVNTGSIVNHEGIFTGLIVHNGSGDLILSDGLVINGALLVTGTGRIRWGPNPVSSYGAVGGGVSINYSDGAIDQARKALGYKPRGIPLRGEI